MRNVPAGDWNVAAASSETSRSRWNNGPASRSAETDGDPEVVKAVRIALAQIESARAAP